MSFASSTPVSDHAQPSFGHAIVIGSSMAGLTAARVLTDHFDRVTLIERDALVERADYRKGVPQARHAHALLLRGRQILEELFPGLTDELIVAGAEPMNMGLNVRWFTLGQMRTPYESEIFALGSSRPLLESTIYRRIRANPKITILQRTEIVSLETDEERTRVTGVRVRSIDGSHRIADTTTSIAADLVVDASGRNSRAPEWLAALGYTPPEDVVISSTPGYASRVYKRPATLDPSIKALYIQPYLPNQSRGGIFLPLEDDRIHVSLVGMIGDHPPTDEEGFVEFARSLPSQDLYDIIKDAEPLDDIVGFRSGENRERTYNKLPRYLEHFLVTGDAVYAFNPIYGQGMSVAALGSMVLDSCLREQREQYGADGFTGLAQRFQARLSETSAPAWQLSTGEDARWAALQAGVEPEIDPMTRLSQRYVEQVIKASMTIPAVADAFFLVVNLQEPPTILFRPDIVLQVFSTLPSATEQLELQVAA